MRKMIINKASCFIILIISLSALLAPCSEVEGRIGLVARLTSLVFAASGLYAGIDLFLGRRHIIQYILGWIVYLLFGAIITVNFGGAIIEFLKNKQISSALFASLVNILIVASLLNCLLFVEKK